MKDLVTVQELAKASGVSVATVDHYVDIGLLKTAKREGTKRLFECGHSIEKIKEIKLLLSKGFLLKAIKEKLNNNHDNQVMHTTALTQKTISRKKFSIAKVVLLILVGAALTAFFMSRK